MAPEIVPGSSAESALRRSSIASLGAGKGVFIAGGGSSGGKGTPDEIEIADLDELFDLGDKPVHGGCPGGRGGCGAAGGS